MQTSIPMGATKTTVQSLVHCRFIDYQNILCEKVEISLTGDNPQTTVTYQPVIPAADKLNDYKKISVGGATQGNYFSNTLSNPTENKVALRELQQLRDLNITEIYQRIS